MRLDGWEFSHFSAALNRLVARENDKPDPAPDEADDDLFDE
jgi:hypothetical protein